MPKKRKAKEDRQTDKAPFGIREWLLLFFLYGVAVVLMKQHEYWIVLFGGVLWYLNFVCVAYLAYVEFRWVWRSRDRLASLAWAVASFVLPTALLLAAVIHTAKQGLERLHGGA